MVTANTTFGFPFAVNEAGRVSATGGDEAVRGKIVQVLFTAPGERVNFPEFGCGLFNLVFEPSNEILVAAMEFTVGQALTERTARVARLRPAIQAAPRTEYRRRPCPTPKVPA